VFLKFGYKKDSSESGVEATGDEIIEQPGICSSKDLSAFIHVIGKNGEGISNKSV